MSHPGATTEVAGDTHMSTTTPQPEHLLTLDEAYAAFDAAARYFMNISGEEFAERWDRGELQDSENPAVMDVAVLRPGGR